MNAAEAPILEARGLVFEYPGPLRALDGVALELRAGELLAVIGPNGCGKSTLLKVLAGLLRPQSGTVQLGGSALSDFTPRERAQRIALVPQFLPLVPDVRVLDFVHTGRYARLEGWNRIGALDRQVALKAMEECDVLELAERALAELSGGQRQRVLVARALAQEPQALLVDEPTNALDPEHQIRVLDLIDAQRSLGRAAIVVTHDLNLAGQYATRLLVLHGGRKVAEGAAWDVLRAEVLEPVYGRHLAYGFHQATGGARAAWVLPRRGV